MFSHVKISNNNAFCGISRMIGRFQCALARKGCMAAMHRFATSWAVGACANRGLLKNATDECWSATLDLKDAVSLVTQRGLLWDAVITDAAAMGEEPNELLRQIRGRATTFLATSKLHGRYDAVTKITEDLRQQEGNFMLLLGGKDVGKTLLLTQLETQLNEGGKHIVVTVSGRYERSTLKMALFKALTIAAVKHSGINLEALKGPLATVLQRLVKSPAVKTLLKSSSELTTLELLTIARIAVDMLTPEQKNALTFEEVLELYEHLAKSWSLGIRTPVIFIDEVNRMLPATTDVEKEETFAMLDRLTRDTKEQKVLSVLLAASEHSEPYRLKSLGFKPEHFTTTVFLNETEPASMYEALVDKWSMGPHFATACMAMYGGQLWRLYQVLGHVAVKRTTFAAARGYTSASFANAQSALKLEGARELLKQLAIAGQVVCDPESVLVQKLSEHNVAAVVQSGTMYAPARYEGEPLLVPASEHMRHVIACSLPDTRKRHTHNL